MNTAGRERLRRVLVVDGDRDLGANLHDILAPEGYEVALAHGAAAAERVLGSFAAEVALIDACLGRGSGIDLIDQLRRHHPNVLCVMMIAQVSTETAIEALDGGAYDYLRKPFQPIELFAALERCSARHELTRARATAEEALRRRHEDLEERVRVYKDVPIGLCELDTSLRYTRINDWLAEINGMAVEEHLGRAIGEVLPDVALGVESQLRQVIETGEPIIGGTAYAETRAEPGVKRTFQHNYYPIRSGDDTVLGVSCMVADITESKQTEEALRQVRNELDSRVEEKTRELHEANEALRESEERVRLLLESTGEAIYGIDLDGNCTFCNPACLTRLRYDDDDDLLGRNMHLAIHHTKPDGSPYPDEECQIHRAFRQARGIHVDDEILWCADGTSFPAEYWSHPVRQDGEVVGAVVGFVDITERKAMEEQLRHAQKMEVVGQLTGGVAHDFNNLLAVIMGNLELLDEGLEGGSRLRGFGQLAMASAQRGAKLTRRLLAFSRKQTLLPRVVDLNGLLTGVLEMLHRTLGEIVEIETVLAGGLWPTYVDAGQLENALLNLAVNARDAMPAGGTLTIETANRRFDEAYAALHQEARAGSYVMLAVSDTGTGMAPEVIQKAFEPFFTTKEVGRGSGLGLSMVYGFVKQSGGHIEIDSEIGHGTTVRAYLPRSCQRSVAVEDPATIPMKGGSGEKILVVEDEDDVRRLVVRVLTSLRYRPLEARDGMSALAVLDQAPEVALLFTDVVLPGGMNGLEIAREARRRRPELKVLFTSGYTENAIVHHSRLDEGVELIEKPYRKESLACKLQAILGREED